MNFEAISQMVKPTNKNEKPEKSQEELRSDFELKFNNLKPLLEQGIKEYEKSLSDDIFEDQEGEEIGSGEKRKQEMQKKLTVLLDRAEKMKAKLDSREELPQEPVLDLESLKLENQAFLEETFKKWYDEIKSKVEQIPTLIDPKTENYTTRKDDIDPTKFGEYTLNPDTQGIDFENILESKIFIPDLSSFEGKKLHEVAKYLIDNFSDKYKIPGIEFWKFMLENPDKVPAVANGVNLKDGNYYFNFGSLVRDSDGRWDVPCARWDGSDWSRSAFWLDNSWSSIFRVVLLEI